MLGMVKVPERTEAHTTSKPGGEVVIDLKDPWLAGFLAWLVPGLGHWYQGRKSKAALFFVCIFGTFLYGLYLGEGRVVYASWRSQDAPVARGRGGVRHMVNRLPFVCQAGVGLPALTAMVQAIRTEPFEFPIYERLMVPPQTNEAGWEGRPGSELDQIQKRLHHYWELGTVYTMIAGLLNVLAIFDAACGPMFAETSPGRKKEDEDSKDSPPHEPGGESDGKGGGK